MTGNRYVVGLDVGTQSAKVRIFDQFGQVAARSDRALRPLQIPAPNRAVHPDDDLWEATVAALSDAVDDFTAGGHDVDDLVAIGICIIRCCRVLLRSDGSLAHPVISWMDERLDHPYAHEDQYGEVSHVTTSSGYIGLRLTGERTDTCANLIGWWPVDDVELDWSEDPDRWRACNLTREQLFDLVRPGRQLGSITDAAASATGLPAGLAVVATAHDKAVEALGSGVVHPGVGLVSLGTYIAAMTPGPHPVADAESFWTFQASLPGHYLYECWGVRRGMWSVSWFRDQFGDAALAAAARDGRPTEGRSIEALLGEEAARVPAGSDGLLTVHDWAAPPQAPFRKGAMIGFDGRHTRAHLYRSVLEGIALRLKNHMDPMAAELDQPFVELVVSGGGANSDLMMQILADVHGVPTRRNRLRSSASIGCAVNAGLFAGVWSTAEEATGVLVEPDDTFDPNPAHTETYRRLADVESGVHSHLDPITRRLNDQPLR